MSDSDVESDSQMQESEITEVESSISEREASSQGASNLREKEEASRGRPDGNTDSSKRYRRTAAEISAEKIR